MEYTVKSRDRNVKHDLGECYVKRDSLAQVVNR